MIIDTNILIRLERESRLGTAGEATRFFESLEETRIYITPTIAGEIACGASVSGRDHWEKILRPFEIVPIDAGTTWFYGVHYRLFAGRGELIGTNDLWIAAAALSHQLPLLTDNIQEFRRVPGLNIIAI